MRISANGNVGIGTWKPVGALDIKTGGNVLVESGNVGLGTISPQTQLVSIGNVGIGTTTPLTKLDVNGDIEVPFANAHYFGDPTTDGSLRLIPSGTNLLLQRRIAGVWTTGTTITG